MTLTADATMRKAEAALMSFRVVNADIVYATALVGLALPGHGSAGYIIPYAPAANLCPIGFAVDGAVTGDTSASPVVEASIDIGGGVFLLTVATIADDVTDIGKEVWPLTDNTFTLTITANAISIGNIVRSHSSTQAWVLVEPMFKLLNEWDIEQEGTPTPTATPSPTPTPT